jgi:hypothetical protein
MKAVIILIMTLVMALGFHMMLIGYFFHWPKLLHAGFILGATGIITTWIWQILEWLWALYMFIFRKRVSEYNET